MIFISYRKADTQSVVDLLADRLKREFGEDSVFKDDSDLHAGERWADRLKQEVLARDVLLAVVGPGWLTAANDDGRRRLDDPKDWVRVEISTALEEGKRVIVLLVGAAKMPSKKDLPRRCPLREPPDLQTLLMRSGGDSEADLTCLIEELRPKKRQRGGRCGRSSCGAARASLDGTATAVLAPGTPRPRHTSQSASG